MKLTHIVAALSIAASASAQQLVIIHTNDTHSQLDPIADGTGGVLRRKVLIDSIRQSNPHTILIDAGDAVQGSLYYTLFKGEAERKMMNALGYDIQILGNHEFDSGMEKLAEEYRQLNAELLSTNYVTDRTPLAGLFKPYSIRRFGNRRVGFMAINLDPKGMISSNLSEGLVCLDGLEAANAMAWYLKHIARVDLVVAITHVGYDDSPAPTPADTDIASKSRNIDIVIGGHSHTTLNPATKDGDRLTHIPNLDGDTVLVAQTGSLGSYLGVINVDLAKPRHTRTSRLIRVDSRLDPKTDKALADTLATYRHAIDSLVCIPLGTLAQEIPYSSQLMRNWVADMVLDISRDMFGKEVDMAIVNRGGLRHGLDKGLLSTGMVMTLMPFDNKLLLLEISGKDLKEAIAIMNKRDIGCFSRGFDLRAIDPDRTYRVATIDYLANGGDYMEPLTRAHRLQTSALRLDDAVIGHLKSQNNPTIVYTDDKPRN